MALVFVLAVFFAWRSGLLEQLNFAALKQHADALRSQVAAQPVWSAALFFLAYVLVTGLSLPGAAIMTLAAGALFGLVWGTVIASFASTLGATLAFLCSRLLFRDWVRARFGRRLAPIEAGVEKDGARYLFSLRLVPAVPFFLINLAMGLTPIRTLTFAWVSQVGMLAGTLVFVNAGTQLAQIESPAGLLSPVLILSLLLLASFPWLVGAVRNAWIRRQSYRAWTRPRSFDRNLIVIGAGAGGLVSSYIAAAVRAKVTLIEARHMGGDCLNYGCVPSKALIRSARLAHDVRHAGRLGFKTGAITFDFAELMARVRRVQKSIEPHDSVERYEGLGVEVLQGHATVLDPWRVEVNGQTLSAPNLVIATGGRPGKPEIPGLDLVPHYTSETIWGLTVQPRRLLIIGGGPIGCELAQVFARLGSEVVLLQRGVQILPREDADVAELVHSALEADGVRIMTEAQVQQFGLDNGEVLARHTVDGEPRLIRTDAVLLAVGRTPNTEGFGLEGLGLERNPDGTLATDAYGRCSLPNLHAVGDVAGPYQFTHAAAHMAWYAAVNALFGRFRRFKIDWRVLPWATFTAPEVARVGLNELDAKAQDIPYELTCYGLDDLDRAICDEAAHGFVKVLTEPGKDRILGATVVGEHAAETIIEFVSAMRHGFGMKAILSTVHLYPSWAEGNKYAAGLWQQARKPERLLRWVERLHRWNRG